MFGLALGQSFSHQMQSMVRNESFTRELNVLRGKPLFLGPRGPLVLPLVDPSVRKKLLRWPQLPYKSSEDPSNVAVDPLGHITPSP